MCAAGVESHSETRHILTVAGIRRIENLRGCTNIRTLTLSGNQVGFISAPLNRTGCRRERSFEPDNGFCF